MAGGEALLKVQAGDPIKLPATAWNAFIDCVRKVEGLERAFSAGTSRRYQQAGIFPVKNDSTTDCPQFGVLGVSGPLVSPTDRLAEFQNNPALSGITPTTASHTGRFVVALEPIAAGRIGRAVLSGIVPVQVKCGTTYTQSEGAADVLDSDNTQLEIATAGAAQLLWIDSGSAETRWAIARLGNAPSKAATFIRGVTTGAVIGTDPTFELDDVIVLQPAGGVLHDAGAPVTGDAVVENVYEDYFDSGAVVGALWNEEDQQWERFTGECPL